MGVRSGALMRDMWSRGEHSRRRHSAEEDGAARRQAETRRRKVELLRCSNSLSERFGKVAKSLTDAAKGGIYKKLVEMQSKLSSIAAVGG
jgi:hypothetical protein